MKVAESFAQQLLGRLFLRMLHVFGCTVAGVLSCTSGTCAAEDWPEFRGPTGQGVSTATQLPREWSAAKNVAWKQTIPGLGWSSPVVSRGIVFLTTGVPDAPRGASLRALALESATGKVLWNTELFTAPVNAADSMHEKNSLASPTVVAEEERIYAHFGPYGTAALDRAGKIIWRNNQLGYNPVNGNGGSPILVGERLIFNGDGASNPFVVALDKHTGEIAWKVPRTVRARQSFSFCTPLLITVNGQPQLITPGSGVVAALDPKDGREIWRVTYPGGYSVVPRPVFGHGLVFISTGYNRADLLAIRADGQGDVTDTHIAWRTSKGAPLTPSMVLIGDELYGISDAGIATCWEAKTGKVHWQERIDGNYSASPLVAEGRIYFQNETGTGVMIKAGRQFSVLATNKLEERTLASYAVAEDAFFIRTEQHLYRIANGAPPPNRR